MNTYMLSFIQGWEWVIILLAVLLLFGAKKLPELAKGLGKGKGKRRKVRTQRPQPLRVAPMLPCGLDLCAGRSSLLLGGLPSSWAAFMRSL